jgi:P4 family phage/plasmid primase-like protien
VAEDEVDFDTHSVADTLFDTVEGKDDEPVKVPVARRFVDHIRFDLRPLTYKTHEGGLMLRYDPIRGIYVPDGEDAVNEWIARQFREVDKVAPKAFCAQVIHAVRSETFTDRHDFNPAGFLCLANGVLDLRDSAHPKLEPHPKDPDKPWVPRFTISVPLTYDPAETCPEWIKFLAQVLKDVNERKMVQQVFGLALVRDTSWKRAVAFLGPPDSGKSTTQAVLRELLGGKPNVTSKTLQQLTGEDRFAAIALVDAFANIYADIPSKATDVGYFKALIGAVDFIDVQAKYGHAFSTLPRVIHLYSANRLPKVRDADEAFYSRWWVLFFPHRFQRGNKPYWERFLPEFPGILNWAIAGLASIRAEGPALNQSADEVQKIWVRWSEPVIAFVEENFDPHVGYEIVTHADMYKHYTDFCAKFGATPDTKNKFAAQLNRLSKQGLTRIYDSTYQIADPLPGDEDHTKSISVWRNVGWKN